MGMSKNAQKAYEKALKEKKKKRRGHWLIIQKEDSFKEKCSKLFTQFCCLVVIACVIVLGREVYLSLSAQYLNFSLKNLYDSLTGETASEELTEGARHLLSMNPDTIGYIRIDDTPVDFPVVQASDNDKYLKTAFDGSSNKAGTVFLDFRNVLTAKKRSDNLVVYGHNQRDRTMFGSLKDYKNSLEHYSAHPYITFNSNYRSDKYLIFAYFVTEVEPSQTADGVIFDYHNYIDLSDREVYERFIANINERTQIITPVDVKYGDEFLTLSTCSGEFEPSRFVIFARKLRKGESLDDIDTSAAYLNPDARPIDWSRV